MALLALAAPMSGASAASSAEEPAGRLRAAKALQDSLTAQNPTRDAWRELERLYAELVAQYPDSAAVRIARGDFWWEIGERESAEDDWREAERREPKRASATARLAQAALALGEARRAADGFERALAIEPDNPALHFEFANVCFLFRHDLLDANHTTEADRRREALAHFAAATKLAPASEAYARAYAETFYSVPNPDWAEAIRAWERVRTLSATPDFALLNLARVYLQMRQFGASRRCLDQVQDTAHLRLKANLTTQLDALESAGRRAAGPGE